MLIDELYINILLGFLTALLFFGLFFWWYHQKKEKELQRAGYESRALKDALHKSREEIHTLTLSLSTYKERVAQISNTKHEMRQEFENIAQHVLGNNSKTLREQNSQNLNSIIMPFKENIKAFHDRLETYYAAESKERFSLTKEIRNLQELNLQISEDAINLTNALKGDNKRQGDWGEMILERVLESSGLKKEREYWVQKYYKNEQSESLRPDVIVNLPGNKQIIIDSKVSLKSYESFYHDKDNEKAHLKAFLSSINTHIKMLSEKSYHDLEGIHSLDFVLLFIPIEGAFLLAGEQDSELFSRAYQHNIILVAPSTLLAVLRVIENSWRFDHQNKNAKVIAKKAGALYDKFSNFVTEMQKIDTSLQKAKDSYDDAFKKLSTGKGNLMNRANELKELEGVVHKKEIKE